MHVGPSRSQACCTRTDLFSCRLECRSWLRSEPRSGARSEERGCTSGRPIAPTTGGPGSTACPAYFVSSSVCLSRMAFQPRYCLPSKWSCRKERGRGALEASAAAAVRPESALCDVKAAGHGLLVARTVTQSVQHIAELGTAHLNSTGT